MLTRRSNGIASAASPPLNQLGRRSFTMLTRRSNENASALSPPLNQPLNQPLDQPQPLEFKLQTVPNSDDKPISPEDTVILSVGPSITDPITD